MLQVRTTNNIIPAYFRAFPSVLDEGWIANVQTPATDILESRSLIFSVYLELDNPSGFLLQQDIPDPKLLSETASRMLSTTSKDVRLVYSSIY